MSRILQLKGRFLGAGVRLLAEAAASPTTEPVWVQIASAGSWKGHAQFAQITFDEAFFNQVITNFHAHPSYKAGADGVGAAKVIPFDYEHASEMKPTDGSIPMTGAPAPGWILELAVRKGEDGTAQLWALADWGDQLREQIKAGSYQWTSVAIWPNAVDKVSGKQIGPVLTSVAITNKPFIEGMAPLTARVEVWGRAESGEEFIVGLRDVLELSPEADVATVKTGLDELVKLYQQDAKPPGYPDGVGYLLNQVRRLLGLRALAMPDEILAAAGQALGALSTSNSPPPQTPAPPPNGPNAMTTNFLTALAAVFAVSANEESILAAATKATGALAALGDLMKQFGATDPADLATKAGAARDSAAKTAEFATKLTEALSALDAGAEQETEKETEQIAASLGFAKDDPRGKSARSVIKTMGLSARRAALGIAVGADGKTLTLTAKDPSKLESFRKEYPLPSAEQNAAALLTTPIAAGANGVQLGGAHTGAAPAGGNGAPLPAHLQELAAYPGRNNIERAVSLLSSKNEGFKLQPWAEQCRLAGNYVATGTLVAR